MCGHSGLSLWLRIASWSGFQSWISQRSPLSLDRPFNPRDEAISQARYCLDEVRRDSVVAQCFPQVVDAVVEYVFEVHESVVRPKTLAESFPGNDFSRALKKLNEDLRRMPANSDFAAIPV